LISKTHDRVHKQQLFCIIAETALKWVNATFTGGNSPELTMLEFCCGNATFDLHR
jgi:hypothetical protein